MAVNQDQPMVDLSKATCAEADDPIRASLAQRDAPYIEARHYQAALMKRVWMTLTTTHPINNATPKTSETANPPEFVTYLIFFLPKKQRDPLLGDLVEEYPEIYARFGRRKANVWYYSQVLNSWWPLLVSCGKNLIKAGVIKWLVQIGAHQWVVEWLHKLIR